MARLSGLQRDVLSLYRQCLRAARQKPPHSREHFYAYARKEFEKNLSVEKKDFGTIEFLLRRGQRMLETFGSKGVTDVGGLGG